MSHFIAEEIKSSEGKGKKFELNYFSALLGTSLGFPGLGQWNSFAEKKEAQVGMKTKVYIGEP